MDVKKQKGDLHWVESDVGRAFPENAVIGGNDTDGSKIYVGRADHKGAILPAKLVPDRKEAYVTTGGKEYAVQTFEVLCGKKFEWIAVPGDLVVPKRAFPIGKTPGGETLYAGRVWHKDALIVGKVHPSKNKLYVGFARKEIPYEKGYDLLVETKWA